MKQLLSIIRMFERTSLVVLLFAMTGLFAFNVLIRLWGGSAATSFGWIDKVVRTMNIFLVFLAAGLALELGKQVAVDSWRQRIAARTGLPLTRIIDATGLAFSLYMAWQSWNMAQFVFASGQVSATMGIAIGWIYVAPCIGFLLLALRYGCSLFGLIDRFNTASEAGQ
ncbi:TRAP transporter small permease [Paracoccus fistulariae]|uniref:TRAP transporter small permease protein n=1 Tax=Paracoccus fistulariae TaxID=658446 RepID=A0ABY7SLM6_9RHOB|nr:TRAP transporter small permease [Paracoccus fistulariae]MDB6182586.1 TRAP transporter small permease [Paracoccus fistulariae]WCR07794.1 TRAP transporter small permease [Paracoccus fistulariae]